MYTFKCDCLQYYFFRGQIAPRVSCFSKTCELVIKIQILKWHDCDDNDNDNEYVYDEQSDNGDEDDDDDVDDMTIS